MSRTDIDAATLAAYLRQICGDGSVEWSYEPMQTFVLLDVADMLDENAKLRESCSELLRMAESNDPDFLHWPEIHDELRKLGVKIVNI